MFSKFFSGFGMEHTKKRINARDLNNKVVLFNFGIIEKVEFLNDIEHIAVTKDIATVFA